MDLENEIQPPENENNSVETNVVPETHNLQPPKLEPKFQEKIYRWFKDNSYLFSFYGLITFYILLGAAYFCYHESKFEIESKTLELSEFAKFQNDFFDKIQTLNDSNEEHFYEIQQKLFDNFVIKTNKLKKFSSKGHLLNETKNDESFWNYKNSIFFATSVVTTIGYSNKLSPETFYGKIGVIIFALLGFPLLWLTLFVTARLISETVDCYYKKYHNLKKKIFYKTNGIELSKLKTDENENDRRRFISFEALLCIFIVFILISGLLLKFGKELTFFESIYICFNTFARIGFGNEIPSKSDNIFFTMIYIIFGLAFTQQCYVTYHYGYCCRIAYFKLIKKFSNFIKVIQNTLVNNDQTEIAENFLHPNLLNIENGDENATGNKRKKLESKIYKCLENLFFFCFLYLYILFGAAYFYYHESASEIASNAREFSKFMEFQTDFFDKMQNFKGSNENVSDKLQQEFFDEMVWKFSSFKNIQISTENHLLNENKLLWSYKNSIFFSISVLTTIGYSNKLSPKTFYGKIGVIIFGFFGIPLLWIAVGVPETIIGNFIVTIYVKYQSLKEKINGTEAPAHNPGRWEIPYKTFLFVFIAYISITGLIIKFWKELTFFESVYITFNTMTTIGFVDQIPSENDNILFISIYIIFGLAVFHMCFDCVGLRKKRVILPEYRK